MRTPLRLNCTTPAGKFDQLARAGSSSASRAAVCCSAVSVPRKACAAATEVVVSAAAPVAGVEAGAGAGADSPGGEASSAQAVETMLPRRRSLPSAVSGETSADARGRGRWRIPHVSIALSGHLLAHREPDGGSVAR